VSVGTPLARPTQETANLGVKVEREGGRKRESTSKGWVRKSHTDRSMQANERAGASGSRWKEREMECKERAAAKQGMSAMVPGRLAPMYTLGGTRRHCSLARDSTLKG
jgi:hypothetical protein